MKKLMLVSVCLVMLIGMFGCGSKPTVKARPSDEELSKAKTVCGVVRSEEDSTLNIQLCGNLFEGREGYCYIDVDNEYNSFNEGDSVLIYYTGNIEYNETDECIKASNIDICYVEKYKNDGTFTANITLLGGAIPEGATRGVNAVCITAIDDEPENQFGAILSIEYYKDGHLDMDKPEERTDVIYEVEDIWEEVTVTYDINTMEVISIIQYTESLSTHNDAGGLDNSYVDTPIIIDKSTGFNISKIHFDAIENNFMIKNDEDVIEALKRTINKWKNNYNSLEITFYFYSEEKANEDWFDNINYVKIQKLNYPARIVVEVEYENIKIETLKELSQRGEISSIHISIPNRASSEVETLVP